MNDNIKHIKYNTMSKEYFFSSILTEIVKYEFNYKLSDDAIVIFAEGREVISYNQQNLRNDFLNYLVSNFSR